MRDKKRIHKVCETIEKVWETVPDWRFGQLFYNIVIRQVGDPFFIEDNDLLKLFEEELRIKDLLKEK